MERYLDIKSRKVIDSGGNLRGTAESLIIDIRNKRINGLLVCNAGLIRNLYMIPIKDIKDFNDPIIFERKIYKVKKSILFDNKEIILQSHIDKDIMDFKGEELGKLTDVIIDLKNYKLRALISSCGFFEDLFDGRKIIGINENTRFHRKCILVDECNFEMKTDVYYKKYLKE